MLEQALNGWQDWGFENQPTLLRRFAHGENHDTGLIRVDERLLVLKVFASSFDQSLFAHTMSIERWTSAQGLSPKTLFANNGIQILEYIDDYGFSPHKLENLAQTISKLHGCDKTQHMRFDLLAFTREYLSSAEPVMQLWHSQLLPLLNEFINDPTPWTFCHNDLIVENCLFAADDRVSIIDWEFAQHHNPWFDIAAVVLYFDLSEADSKRLLKAYSATWAEKINARIFISSQISVLWTDLLWHSHKLGPQYQIDNPRRFAKLKTLAAQLGVELTRY